VSTRIKRDGSRQSREEKSEEARVRRQIEDVWGIEVIPYHQWDQMDWRGVRGSRTVANFEHKGRTIPSDKYETVFLSQHKYMTLLMSYLATGTQGLFVVSWSDGVIRYVNVADMVPRRLMECGHNDLRIAETRLAVEPCFRIRISEMELLPDTEQKWPF
jgi:hypothetical protein